nr:retrovirus-related Pol polyprotein from transposon TNT 1-94 [Tanacetum cinerariifolium]
MDDVFKDKDLSLILMGSLLEEYELLETNLLNGENGVSLSEGKHVTWAHSEKKRTRLRIYTKSLEESCSRSVETAPSHEGYMNTIEPPDGNNVVPLRSDTIQLVQNGCSFHGLRFEDPNQQLKYCMENPEQAFVEYASSHTDKAGGKWYTFKPEQNNLGDNYNPSWKSHPNFRWRQPQNSQNNFSNPPNRFQLNSSFPNHSFNNNPQSFNSQSNLEGLVSNFMASQDARLFKFVADFKQQQSKMTNKIDTILKAIIDRITGALPSDTVKNPKLNVNSTSLVLSARSYPTEDPQCSTQIHSSINAITICPERPGKLASQKKRSKKRRTT